MKYLQGLGGYSAEMYSRPITSSEKVSAAGSTAASDISTSNPIDGSPAAVVSLSMNPIDPLKKIGNYGNILEKIRGNRAMAAAADSASKSAEPEKLPSEQKSAEPVKLPSEQKSAEPVKLPAEQRMEEQAKLPAEKKYEEAAGLSVAHGTEAGASETAGTRASGISGNAEGYSVADELEKQNERRAEAAEKLDEQNAERAERAKEYYDKLDEQNERRAEANKEAVNRLRENLKEIVKKQVLVKDDGVYLETTITKNGSSTSRRVRIG